MTADIDRAVAEAARAEVEHENRDLSDALMMLREKHRLLTIERNGLRERLDGDAWDRLMAERDRLGREVGRLSRLVEDMARERDERAGDLDMARRGREAAERREESLAAAVRRVEALLVNPDDTPHGDKMLIAADTIRRALAGLLP